MACGQDQLQAELRQPQSVGVILDAVERLGLWENTIIIFWSCHGFHLAGHGNLWRKMRLFEVPSRVPFVVAAPKIKGNVTSPLQVELVDMFPTLTDATNTATPKGAAKTRTSRTSLVLGALKMVAQSGLFASLKPISPAVRWPA